ncbi:MAG: endonuclease V [Armatimonadota bacterium]|nr:endonuclease V [Armatimonadota bacterium]
MSEWTDGDVASGERLQRELAPHVRRRPLSPAPETVAGAAFAFADERVVQAAAVLVRRADLSVIESATDSGQCRPYRAGLLAMSVGEAVRAAVLELPRPDALMLLGHGIAHPRRCGLASHLGLRTGLPTVGLADRPLVGDCDEPDAPRGSWTPLEHESETIGAALRTQNEVRPLIVSVGHLVTLEDAIDLVLACAPRYRWPEPIREARRLAREAISEASE